MSYKIHDTLENEENAKNCLYNLTHGMTYDDIYKKYGKTKSYWYSLMSFYKEKWGFSGVISLYHWFKYTNEIEKIKEMYVTEKKATVEIGKIYGVSDKTIANFLRKEGIEIRSVGYESRTDQTLFNEITTEMQAYVIGLITADGSMTREERSLSITLTQSDDYLLKQINEFFLNGSGHLILSKEKAGKNTTTLQFHGKRLCEALKKHGIVPDKSHFLTQLSQHIPAHLYHHYIRGLFDGDGVCSKSNGRVRIGYCACRQEFVESYRSFLNKELNLPLNKLFNTGGCWQVSWGAKKDLENFYNYIYKDATIFLGRKKQKLAQYLNLT